MSLITRSRSYDRLVDVPFFAGWTPEEVAHVERVADYAEFPAGSPVLPVGSERYEFVVLLEGEVDISLDDYLIARLGPGDHVAELALLDGSPRSASATALTPVRAVRVEAERFSRLASTMPSLDRKLLLSLTQRLRANEWA